MLKLLVAPIAIAVAVLSPSMAGAQTDTPQEQFVKRVYAAQLGREPAQAGLDYWTGIASTKPAYATVESVMNSPEFQNYGPSFEQIYLNLLERPIDPQGAAYWATVPYRSAVTAILLSDEALAVWDHQPLPAPPPAPVPAHNTVWDRLAQCESGGNWHINTGNGYYGGVQFSLQSWRGVGGTGYPHQHSRETQIEMAERLLDVQGWRAWPGCSKRLGLR